MDTANIGSKCGSYPVTILKKQSSYRGLHRPHRRAAEEDVVDRSCDTVRKQDKT